jgi:hypothetical protein
LTQILAGEYPHPRLSCDAPGHGTVDYYRNLIYEYHPEVFVDKLPAQLPPFRAVNHHIPIKIDKPWMAAM